MPSRAARATAALLALALATPGRGRAQGNEPPAAAAREWTWSASLRTRAERWDWFDAGGEGRYAFSGSLARAGMGWQRGAVGVRIEAAAPLLLALPADALAPAPAGQLGLGAGYYAANDSARDVAAVFLKNAYVDIGRSSGHRIRIGRMEFADGAEATPVSSTLAAVKRDRVAQRLLGPFGWSHVGRSFDGGLYTFARGTTNLSVLGARATRGAFDANGWDELKAGVVYAAATTAGPWSPARSDVRVFGLYYRDDRRLPKADNRPAATRSADSARVALTTLGGHALQEVATAAGAVDLMAWGAVQLGDWGQQRHEAWAAAVELGFQPRLLSGLRPWIRVGASRASGDAAAADDRHETFVPILPTPRIYARMPFYTAMNLDEAFGSIILRPGTRVTVRADIRALRVAEPADLWYSGGGAFEPNSFGYAGRPSGGEAGLATLIDLSTELRINRWATVTAYLARAAGAGVTGSVYAPGSSPTADRPSASFGYLEVELRRQPVTSRP